MVAWRAILMRPRGSPERGSEGVFFFLLEEEEEEEERQMDPLRGEWYERRDKDKHD